MNQHLGIFKHLQYVETFEVQTPLPPLASQAEISTPVYISPKYWLGSVFCQMPEVVCQSGELIIGLTVQCTICFLFRLWIRIVLCLTMSAYDHFASVYVYLEPTVLPPPPAGPGWAGRKYRSVSTSLPDVPGGWGGGSIFEDINKVSTFLPGPPGGGGVALLKQPMREHFIRYSIHFQQSVFAQSIFWGKYQLESLFKILTLWIWILFF